MPKPASIKKLIEKNKKPKYKMIEVDESQSDASTYLVDGKYYKKVKDDYITGQAVKIAGDSIKRI